MDKKKILIADDNEVMLEVLSETLIKAGYDVETTFNGDTLLSRNSSWPDLILLDIMMLGRDGREICKILKTEENSKNIPIIMISASHQLKNSALMAGANDFIGKPFYVKELLHSVEKHLNENTKKVVE